MKDFIGDNIINKEWKKMKLQNKKFYRRYFWGLTSVKEVKNV